MANLKFAGAGTVPAGEYEKISISGSGRITGDFSCESFSASGSCGGSGNIDCKGDFKVAGSAHIDGNIKCGGALKCSGSCTLGNISAEEVGISGSCKADRVYGTCVRISGGIRISGDLEGEEVKISGGGNIDGLLNAEKLSIVTGGNLNVGSIGGTQIRVEKSISGGELVIFGIRIMNNSKNGKLTTESIEGDEIYLENTNAEVVRGKRVTIGCDCKIGRVEYTESYSCDESSVVGESIQL